MNVKKCVKASGYDINNVILSPLAAAHSTLTKRQKELGVLAIDIGSATTGLAVYEDGDVIHTQILPVGSGHITNDIAIGLRIDIDMAENIKLEYGYCVPEDVSKKDTIDLTKIGHNESLRANKKEIAEIIEARLEEIFDLVNKELKKINKQSLLPAGVVLLGGGAKLPGIVDLAKKMLKLPAHVGSPQEVDGLSDYIEDPAYATAVGLVKWDADISGPNRKAGEAGFWGLVKKMLGALMP
jgi:cell division protein FtsA